MSYSATRTEELSHSEIEVLEALRTWVASVQCERDPLAAILGRFDDVGLPAKLAFSMHSLMRMFSHAVRRFIDVRCVRCTNLSPDEARFIEALSVLQRSGIATKPMAEMLTPTGLRVMMPRMSALATEFAEQGIRLPVRMWDYKALEANAAPLQDPVTISSETPPTFH